LLFVHGQQRKVCRPDNRFTSVLPPAFLTAENEPTHYSLQNYRKTVNKTSKQRRNSRTGATLAVCGFKKNYQKILSTFFGILGEPNGSKTQKKPSCFAIPPHFSK